MTLCISAFSQEVVKLGLIGLDTSHSTAFSKLINGTGEEWSAGFKVVAAYPYGSQTIKSSYERIPKYIEEVQTYGVEVVNSIADPEGEPEQRSAKRRQYQAPEPFLLYLVAHLAPCCRHSFGRVQSYTPSFTSRQNTTCAHDISQNSIKHSAFFVEQKTNQPRRVV